LQVNSETDSTSSITGAAIVVGGMGIGKKLYVGSGINTTTGTFTSTVSTTQLTSTIAQGTAPFVVTSTTPVTNLKSDWVVTNANMTGPITGTGNVTSITSQTGTGTKFVVDNSPTLITPDIGVATATTVNKVTITAPATNSVLTIANNKTLTASNSITIAGTDSKTLTVTNSVAFSGTDSSTLAFRAGGQVAYTDKDKLSAFLATTSAELATVISDETGTGVLVFSTSPAFTTSITTGSTSFDLINTTATTVNFAKAATALSIGAATGTTTVNNNLQVTGDIYFNGTASKLSSTNIEVNDALVYFGANNIGDLLDLGWIGRYNNGVVNDAHVGFIRSAADKEWKLFSNITAEPTTTVDLTGATYDNLRIGKLTTTGVNKVAITAPTTSATLTIADGATFATSGAFTTTITSTANTAVTLPTSGILVNTSVTTLSSLASVGTITSGTWSGSFGIVSGSNLTSLTAGNLSGTIPSAVLANSTQYIGTTAITLSRASLAQTLTGVSIDGNAATVTSGVYTTGSYADPAWLTSLAYSKITGTPSAYSLLAATTTTLGGVKVDGSSITINGSGVISTPGPTLKTINSSSLLGSGDIAVVSSLSVTSANGFAGSISGTSSSAITISTSITGLLKGNGTAISAATVNTDYLPATSPAVTTSLTTPSTSFDLINTTATTVNFAKAATTLSIGAATGTTTINNAISSIFDATFNSCVVGSGSYSTNIRVGFGTLANVTAAGVRNTSVGYAPLSYTTSGTKNTAIGYGVLNVNSTGSSNTAIGSSALIKNSIGNYNVALGSESLINLTTSVATITFTAGSGYTANSTFTAAQLVYSSGTVAGSYPTATIVTNASGVVTSVTLVTYGTGFTDATTVMTYASMGAGTGFTVTAATLSATGSSNIAIGYQTLLSTTTSGTNIAIGTQSLALNTTGSSNTAIGHAAGYAGSSNANATGSNNVYVGYYAIGSGTANTNEIVIGSSAIGLGSNSTVIGNSTTTSAKIFGALTLAGSSSTLAAILTNMAEVTTVIATAAATSVTYYTSSQAVLYYTTAASSNWAINITHSAGTTLNTALGIGQSITVAFLVTQGATAYYNTAVQIDGTAVTPKWQGGSAPTSGNTNALDVYSYTVIKTAASTFTVLASITKFA
jgi:hypothetical protein